MTNSRKSVAVALAVCAVAIGALVVMKKPAAPPIVVASDDGSAELHIQPHTMPEGVDVASITVKRVAVDSEGVLAKYELQPSGLAFSEPAKLLMRIPLPEQPSTSSLLVPVPTVVLQDEDGTGEKVPTSLAFNEARTGLEVVVPVRHFSAVTTLSFVEARIDEVGDKLVRQPFMAGARVTQARTEVRVPIEGDPARVAYVFTAERPVLYSGRLVASPIINPEEIRDVPQSLELPNGPDGRPTYGIVRTFACKDVGDARMVYIGHFDVQIKAFTVDAQDRRTPIDLELPIDADDQFRAETQRFRCLTSAETTGEEIIIDGGDGTGSATTTIRTSKGTWEAGLYPSRLIVPVGESFTVDAVITDVTDRLLATIPEADRAKYRTAWETEGMWHITEGIYDRGPTVVAPKRETPYGGRLTYQLPLTCEHDGVGPISLELNIGRRLQPTPSIVPGLDAWVDTRLPAVYVRCVGPSTPPPPPPPPEEPTQPVRLQVTPNTLQAVHRVGTTECPQKMGTVRIDGPTESVWTASGIPNWIDMPESGPYGDVDIYFNCDIDDLEPHEEKATITIKGDGGSDVESNLGVGIHVRD